MVCGVVVWCEWRGNGSTPPCHRYRAEKLRLHTSPSAFPNPQRLRLFALEKGIEDELQEVVYDTTPGGDQRKWPHLKINPWGDADPGASGAQDHG
jgi:hypothetical protein